MIDFMQEDVISMAEAAKLLPGRPNLSTIWRWYRKGRGGVRLETIKCGSKRLTSVEAIGRFVERCTAVADGDVAAVPAVPRESATARDRRLERVEEELIARGI